MESTPVSRASLETRCGGIRLQSCPSTLSLDAVGLVFLFFTSAEWQSQRAMPTTFFCALAKTPMGCLWIDLERTRAKNWYRYEEKT